MKPVDRVCGSLALTIYHVRQYPTAAREAEVARLRRLFIDLWVSLAVGRISAKQAEPHFDALEQDMLRCRAYEEPPAAA
ncbi:hypothetical protein [Deinococcus sp. QL22]|uniref:hypothetical protein n=1 Tax=Deinococcus sp. QL22 TaxID=2939437 RepID=UPI002016E272|nr:hypothetical protein [Deinococcus sp. QL22]